MIDQAYALRNLVKDRTNYGGDCLVRQTPYTVAITSGKGGVGKTSLAVNLAITIAGMRGGARLIDADFGLSNAEVRRSMAPSSASRSPWGASHRQMLGRNIQTA